MSGVGTKRTSRVGASMSARRGKADEECASHSANIRSSGFTFLSSGRSVNAISSLIRSHITPSIHALRARHAAVGNHFIELGGADADVSQPTFATKSAMSGSSTFTCRLVGMPVGMSFGQPGFPQSLLVARQVFSTSIGAKHVVEIRNSQRGI
jgi:hypothetical protein